MSALRLAMIVTLAGACGLCLGARASDRVLVVVNDASPVSREIGDAYARQRQLAPEQVCHL
ncbi:MAG: hypothetical protein WAO20_05470, partial [Acidobacteriota bacterium]